MTKLGEFVEKMQARADAWRRLFFALLAALIALNFCIRPDEAEYAGERTPGFWAAFALIGAVVMIFSLKRIAQPLLARREKEERDDA